MNTQSEAIGVIRSHYITWAFAAYRWMPPGSYEQKRAQRHAEYYKQHLDAAEKEYAATVEHYAQAMQAVQGG